MSAARRQPYLDLLRILACFWVIVNHTNSYVFKAATPMSATWTLSILWYYLSKTAVPLFVMVSGACLLPRQDSYRRAMQRVLRMLLALLLFSYGYYLFDVWETWWTWERALDIVGFLRAVWRGRVTDSFWYLYFYLGLLVMLPMFQRLAKGMDKRDLRYLLCVTFGLGALWPLLTHYVPTLALPEYMDLTLPGALVGLFFAGHYLCAYVVPKPWHGWACVAMIAFTLLWATGLTALEAAHALPGEKYWFMDDRAAPALPVILCAMAVMLLAKTCFALREEARRELVPKRAETLASLGSCAFAIYLLQDLLIAETRYRVFVPLCMAMNPFLAGLIWSIGVFAVLLPVAWGMGRIPGLKLVV